MRVRRLVPTVPIALVALLANPADAKVVLKTHCAEESVYGALERLETTEHRLRQGTAERETWLEFLEDLRRRPQWRLQVAGLDARWRWIDDPILDDPGAARRAGRAEWRRWRARYLEAFGRADGLYCQERRKLGKGWWRGARPVTTEAVLAAPFPEDPEEALCRARVLNGGSEGSEDRARDYVRRYRAAVLTDPERHEPLLALLEPTDPEALTSHRLRLAADPTSFEARLALLTVYREQGMNDVLEREIDALWPDLDGRERVALCSIYRWSPDGDACADRIVADPENDDTLPYHLFDARLIQVLGDEGLSAALAWLDRAPDDYELALWRSILALDPDTGCRAFLERWDAGAVGLPPGELATLEHPAVTARLWLTECGGTDRLTAWRARAGELYGEDGRLYLGGVLPTDAAYPEVGISDAVDALEAGDLTAAANAARTVFDHPEADPRDRAEARYLLGRVALDGGEADEAEQALDHLEAHFLARLRFTGCVTKPDCDRPFRALLRRLDPKRLARYRRAAQKAELRYLETLAGEEPAARGLQVTRLPALCDDQPCSTAGDPGWDDRALIDSADTDAAHDDW